MRNRFSLLWNYVLIGLLTEIVSAKLTGMKYYPGNIFILIEFLFFSFYYRKFLFRNDWIFGSMLVLLAAFYILDTLFRSPTHLNFEGGCVFCAIYIVYGLSGYFIMLKKQELVSLGRSPFFWVNTALFFYGSGCLLLFLFGPYLYEEAYKSLVNLWLHVFVFFSALLNLLLGIAMYFNGRQ